ncbi:MAG: T9SS type A sorting domain-containing protein [Chitinophagales bacterium]|nr:T9SS type A sorting domain-containing protein [Chitinophagales bacterium]
MITYRLNKIKFFLFSFVFAIGLNAQEGLHLVSDLYVNDLRTDFISVRGHVTGSRSIFKATNISTPTTRITKFFFETNGTSNQNIQLLQTPNYRINNGAGVTLLAPLAVDSFVRFEAGKVNMDRNNDAIYLSFSRWANYSGYKNTSFVDGHVRKTDCNVTSIMGSTFWFPTGQGPYNAPIGINTSPVQDVFTAMYYIRPDNSFIPFDVLDLALQNNMSGTGSPYVNGNVSQTEYWKLVRNSLSAATSPMTVTLDFRDPRSGMVSDQGSLVVAEWKVPGHSAWQNADFSNIYNFSTLDTDGDGKPNYWSGQIASGTVSFLNGSPTTYLTIGTYDNTLNPLPIEIKSFTNTCKGDVIEANLITAGNIKDAEKIVFLGGDDLTSLQELASLPYQNDLMKYSVNIPRTKDLNYVKAEIRKSLGATIKTRFIPVDCGLEKALSKQSLKDLSIFPNPSSSHFYIDFQKEDEFADYEVYDMLGRLHIEGKVTDISNSIDISHLAPQNYFVKIKTANRSVSLPITVKK